MAIHSDKLSDASPRLCSLSRHHLNPDVLIREATQNDERFVAELMDEALTPYYGGDHRAHARRIFSTHMAGGFDAIGYFSFEQRMYIAEVKGERVGMIHLVGKRQGTFKISPIIVSPNFRGPLRVGNNLLMHAEFYAQAQDARQIYCTVARENKPALKFFMKNGYVIAGMSASHYKSDITEVMLYKNFYDQKEYEKFDRYNISVFPCGPSHESQVRELLLRILPKDFNGIDNAWVDALFEGYKRRDTQDINQKYKLIFVAVNRAGAVLGVAGATPKKGSPIKIMPFIARSLPAFVALLSDIPYELRHIGHKLYLHVRPTVSEVMALQQRGWRLDAALPAAYHPRKTTQQWSLDLLSEDVMRTIRVKQRFLDHIRSGQKTLEVRVGYNSIQTIKPGERIRLMSRDQSETIVVRDIRKYATFSDMIAVEKPEKIAPDVPSEEVLPLLRRIYPPDRERLGVVVLDIAVDHRPQGSIPKDAH